jgi:hypothetical protein
MYRLSEDEWGQRARLDRHVEPQGEQQINLVMMNRRNHPETPEPKKKGTTLTYGFLSPMRTFPIVFGE